MESSLDCPRPGHMISKITNTISQAAYDAPNTSFQLDNDSNSPDSFQSVSRAHLGRFVSNEVIKYSIPIACLLEFAIKRQGEVRINHYHYWRLEGQPKCLQLGIAFLSLMFSTAMPLTILGHQFVSGSPDVYPDYQKVIFYLSFTPSLSYHQVEFFCPCGPFLVL